ncbi:TIR domain-containing protein [uncultured Arcticibacterium sp.]|uniref:TIR domain-containing protein n=1 Tax=uncultured Arcticibacterium sp. TaxID=2173042 RepID=UPI0030F7D6A9
MEIKFLKNQGFTEIKKIEELKISKGRVEFDKDGETSKIIEPDLRYYWDEELFGLHLSDDTSSGFDWMEFLTTYNEIVSKARVLYFGRSQIESFKTLIYVFGDLEFLYLSENKLLTYVELKNMPVLETFEASHCSLLKTVDLNGKFNKLKWIDLSYSNLDAFSLQNADFPNLQNINMTKNTFRNKGVFTFHTCPNLHFVLGLEALKGIDEVFFEGNDLNVRKLVAKELIRSLEDEININRPNVSRIQLANSYKLSQEDFIYFLDLGHLNLEKIPESILEIKSIEHLCLGAYFPNKIDSFGPLIWEESYYHKKTRVNHNSIQSKELEKLKELSNLRSLYLNSIDLDSLVFLKYTPNLISLDVSGNRRIEHFRHLKELKELKLFHGSSIKGFDDLQTAYLPQNLISLSLESCSLTKLGFLESLAKLEYAFLGCNQISTNELLTFIFDEKGKPNTLRISRIKYTNFGESGIYINENPIEEGLFGYLDNKEPKEKLKLLQKYFDEHIKEDEISFKQIKIILLGNTQAGKTTFFDILNCHTKRYKMKSKDGESTHGVNISSIEYLDKNNAPEFILKVYDFGGQDYYHSTHWPYFTQSDTKYLVIYRSDIKDEYSINNKGESLYTLNYWLDSIKKYAFKNENPKEKGVKTNIIQNIYSTISSTGETPIKQNLNLKDLEKEYEKVLVLNVSNSFDFEKRRDNIDRERLKFKKGFVGALKDETKVKTSLSKSRYAFLKTLKGNPKGIIEKVSISYPDKSEEWIEVSLDFAQNTNDIIYNKEGSLKGFVITNIEKFNSYIFQILKNEKDGYFNSKDIDDRLKGSGLGSKEIQFIVNFMLENEIVFETKENHFLAPAFLSNKLSVSEELLVETFSVPMVEYIFKAHFHSNIFTKIVIAFSKDNSLLEDGWKYVLKKGYVFLYEKQSSKEGQSLVKKNLLHIKFELEPSPKIKVYNHALFGVKDEFFEKIHNQLDELVEYEGDNLRNIEKLVFNKNKKRVNYQDLVADNQFILDGKGTALIQYENELFRKGDFRIFLSPEERKKLKMKKIFISYSKFDEVYKEEFKSHLATLKNQDLVETFDDRDIESGSKFDTVIKQKIVECDLFICLISRHFLNVKYIFEEEFPYALDHGKTIIPIIIRPCDWEAMPIGNKGEKLGDWNAPDKGKVITQRPEGHDEKSQVIIGEYTSNERDAMWLKFVKKIREIIQND